MATPYTRNFNQTATWYARGANDGFGGAAYAAGVVIACRWENKNVMFRDQQAREVVSNAVVYVDRTIQIGDMLAEGDVTAELTQPSTSAKEVRGLNSSPSLNASEVLHKAMI